MSQLVRRNHARAVAPAHDVDEPTGQLNAGYDAAIARASKSPFSFVKALPLNSARPSSRAAGRELLAVVSRANDCHYRFQARADDPRAETARPYPPGLGRRPLPGLTLDRDTSELMHPVAKTACGRS